MKSILSNMLSTALVGSGSTAYAASGAETDGSSLLLGLFIGFGALIVVFQLFPGTTLFVTMIKGLFSPRRATATTADKADRAS